MNSSMCGLSASTRRDRCQISAKAELNSFRRPSVREHRDALLEAVERFALHVDQGVVAALEREALGLVVEEVGDAAVGPLLGHDVQDAAVGQVPPVFLRGARP